MLSLWTVLDISGDFKGKEDQPPARTKLSLARISHSAPTTFADQAW